ncbi:unnamed protein product [Parnassius apollo]|uniref:(apollo) hypothetical protein n=1 Tax=Parnassius apollo TaxID=110799 RepID=A0A8S3XVM3_PARAO|nr:unnamed protein product [Parnassius apollo]
MYSISDIDNKRANIQPSARKSIHSNCDNCPFFRIEDMGKYGLGNEKNHRVFERSHPKHKFSSHEDQGQDVVDNVMSKLARHSSPKTTTKKTRRNSVDGLYQNKYSNESDDEDDSDDIPEINYLDEENLNSSESLIYATPQRTRLNESDITHQNISPYSFQDHTNVNIENKSSYKQFLLVSLLIAVIAVAGYYSDILSANNQINHVIYDKNNFDNEITYLGGKYKVTDDSILQIRTGISTIFQRQDAGSFIFAYNSQSTNFNPIFLNNFINDIAFAAAKYLRNESYVQNYVVVDSSKIDMKVHSELIEKYREDVAKTGVMLVKDLDEIPAPLAMAFHYYCDEFNPLIKRSAIFFTLDMAKCSDQKISHVSIEKCLAKKWANIIPKDNIVPLLTRVVSIVVDVASVF